MSRRESGAAHRSATVFRSPTSTGSTGLPPELIARSRSRLAKMTGVFGLISAIALLLGLFYFRPRIQMSAAAFHAGNILLCVAIAWMATSRRFPPGLPLNLGLAYNVLICWAISFITNSGMVAAFGRAPHLTWSSILIVVYPMLIPLPPRRLLVASILAAAGTPLSLYILEQTGRYQPDTMEYVGLSLNPAFAVVLAYVGARMIYSISRDASLARQIGAYQLEARLGQGGMGEVWRARHRMLARPAAVKLIARDRLGTDPSSAQEATLRFEREAQSTAALRSSHTVQVYDYGVSEDGSFYYVMELLDGLDFQMLVAKHGPIPAGRAVHFLRQACHSLGEAHSHGLIHRDVKPANIFTCRYGPDLDFVKVLDFGLVRERARSSSAVLTREEGVVGTPAFMAPEMASGAPVDGRADIYALACVAHWLLSGTHLFQAETPMQLIAAHLRDAPPPLSSCTELDIPEDLEQVILSCLEKDPQRRPSSAEELGRLLSECRVRAWEREEAAAWWQLFAPSPTTEPTSSMDVDRRRLSSARRTRP